MYKYSFLALLLLPTATHAQSLQTFIPNLVGFLNTVFIPFLLGIGFLFFAINAIRYFVFSSAEEQGREKAKSLAIYGVAAFVIIVVFWGVINLITASIGLGGTAPPQPDYIDPNSVQNSGVQTGGNQPQNILPPGYNTTPTTPVNTPPSNNQPLPTAPPVTNPPSNNAATGNPVTVPNVACSVTLGNGSITTIITTVADCNAQGGQITLSNP
jgi:hypothetical protein